MSSGQRIARTLRRGRNGHGLVPVLFRECSARAPLLDVRPTVADRPWRGLLQAPRRWHRDEPGDHEAADLDRFHDALPASPRARWCGAGGSRRAGSPRRAPPEGRSARACRPGDVVVCTRRWTALRSCELRLAVLRWRNRLTDGVILRSGIGAPRRHATQPECVACTFAAARRHACRAARKCACVAKTGGRAAADRPRAGPTSAPAAS